MEPKETPKGARWCAIALPALRIEIARGEEGRPLAVVIARVGGAVRDEMSLLGNTRLDEVSPEAYALGVRRGQTIAAARARTADLNVRVVLVSAVDGALASIAEAALGFGSGTSFESGGIAGDVVWCDVTGCAHLFAQKEPGVAHEDRSDGPSGGDKGRAKDGEVALARALSDRVRAMGHACRLAISDGPRIAAAAARFAPRDKPGPLLIPAGKGAAALHRLPLAALPLGVGTVAWIRKLGVRTAGDLARLPRSSLGGRLGVEAPRVMQLLEGDDRERLPPFVPPEVPEERLELEYGVAVTEALVFVVKRLSDRLACKLAGRCSKARRLDLVLSLDRALLPDRAGDDPQASPSGLQEGEAAPDKRHPQRVLSVVSPAPLGKADELVRVLRARLEAYAIEAPVLAVALRATEIVPSTGKVLDLFVPEARADRVLPELGAELVADLGEGNVGTFALCDSWLPGDRARIVPLLFAGTKKRKAPLVPLLSGSPEPSRWIGAGLPFERESKRTLLERIEAVEWWKRRPSSKSFYLTWAEGEHAMAFVEVDGGAGDGLLRGWLD